MHHKHRRIADQIDSNKKVLYDATKGRDRGLQISSSTHFMNLSYQHILLELENALQKFSIHKIYDNDDDDNASPYRKDRVISTNFTGQGFYKRNNRNNQSLIPNKN